MLNGPLVIAACLNFVAKLNEHELLKIGGFVRSTSVVMRQTDLC